MKRLKIHPHNAQRRKFLGGIGLPLHTEDTMAITSNACLTPALSLSLSAPNRAIPFQSSAERANSPHNKVYDARARWRDGSGR